MGKDGLFFKAFAIAHPRFNTPSIALLGQGVWSACLILIGSFDELTDMLIFASFIFYGLGAFGIFRLRKVNNSKTAIRIPSWIPILYIAFCAVLVVVNLFQNPKEALTGIGLIALGAPLYFYFKSRKEA
jgi:basic amino acid/polyamine antiporter, APA family